MDLMIDIETGGVQPNCAIFSIGALFFDPTSDRLGDSFYEEISHESNKKLERQFEIATMNWWAGKAPNGNAHIASVLNDLIRWIVSHKPRYVWANSPSFDLVILKNVINKINLLWPLPYHAERDVRTIKALAWPDESYHLNNSHNALADCTNQARLVQAGYKILWSIENETREDHTTFRNCWKSN